MGEWPCPQSARISWWEAAPEGLGVEGFWRLTIFAALSKSTFGSEEKGHTYSCKMGHDQVTSWGHTASFSLLEVNDLTRYFRLSGLEAAEPGLHSTT